MQRRVAQRVDLVAFGECLVPGYPFWVERTDGARFGSDLQQALFAHYVDQAVDIEAGHLDCVTEAARRNRTAVVFGILERPASRGESVYASAVSIGRLGGQLQFLSLQKIPGIDDLAVSLAVSLASAAVATSTVLAKEGGSVGVVALHVA